MTSSRWATVLGIAVLVGFANKAHADAPSRKTVTLVYAPGVAASCPDESSLRSAVSVRLGYDPFEAKAERTVTATIARDRSGLHADVTLRGAHGNVEGSRRLTSATNDCVELGSTLALAISIAIDPLSLTRSAATEPAQPAAAFPTALTESAPEKPAEPPRERGAPVKFRLGLDGGAAFGATPGTSLLGGVFAGVSYRSFFVELEGRAHTASAVDASPRGSVRASLLVARLAPCLRRSIAIGCLLVGGGELVGSGSGVDAPDDDATFYADAGGRLGVEVPLVGGTSLRVFGDLLFPLVTTKLRLRGAEVWSTPLVTAALGASLIASFP